MWTCTGFDHSTFTSVNDVLSHQRVFPGHVVEENSENTAVGVTDIGYVVLRGPDGRVKDVVGLN